MKKNYFKLLIIEMFLLVFSFFSCFYTYYNIKLYLLELVILSIVIMIILRSKARTERFEIELLLIILITTIFYYVITYFLGFFTGFYYTTYSRSLFGIIQNIFYAAILIYFLEKMREKIIKSAKEYKSLIILSVGIFTLLELPSIVTFRSLTSNKDVLEVFISIIIPIFSKNIFLTYSTLKTNHKISIIYQLIMTIPTYILPFFPNFGDYFSMIINSFFPILMLILGINIMTTKKEKEKNSRNMVKNKILQSVVLTFLIVIILTMTYLTSGMFRFSSLAIGSGSMTGTINKGDIVIIDKEKFNPKKGDIIAFQEDGKIIIHRVVRVIDKKEGMYKTKGDFNKNEDSWVVKKENIVGKVRKRIVFLGWPTVKLSELISK